VFPPLPGLVPQSIQGRVGPAKFDSSAIAAACGGVVVRPGPAGAVTADGRALSAGEWFVALAGDTFDDHTFVPEAARRGAGVVVSREVGEIDVPMVRVTDTWAALRDLGRAARRRFDGPVVGITGSTGKTTTRALVVLALSPLGEVHQNEGNSNAEPGVPLTLLTCPRDAAAQAVELGARRPGGIERLSRVAEPSVRLLLNVGPAHLAHLGDLEGVAREKGALLRTARPGDTCVVALDDPRVAGMPLPSGVRRVTFGEDGDVALLEANLDPVALATTARWRTPAGEVSARLPTPSGFVARDAAAALAVAWACGVDLAEAAAALERYEPVGGRMRVLRLASGVTVLDDTFNANPVSLAAALRVLVQLPGRRAAVIGDMLELGDDEARMHREVVALAGQLGLTLLVLVGPRMVAAASPPATTARDAEEAARLLWRWVQPGDHVLIKGSRGMGLQRVLDSVHCPRTRSSGT
jgi:UDP-N-acetylmuramoyl-tripeptide--D-alanyl-D-alanine ligase